MGNDWYKIAIDYRKEGRLDQAIEAMKKAVAESPEDADYHNYLGVCYSENGQHKEALEAVKKAVQLQPENAVFHNYLGFIYHKLNQFAKAVEQKREAIRLKPKNSSYHYSLGVSYHQCGMYKEAIHEAKLALDLYPDNPQYHHSLGLSYRADRQYESSLEVLKKAVELEPKNPEYHYSLGNSYDANQQFEEAVQAKKKAVDLQPGIPKFYFGMGISYWRMGNLDLSISFLEQAADQDRVLSDGRLAVIYYYLGWVHFLKTSSSQLAIPYFEEGKHVYENYELKTQIIQFVKLLCDNVLNGNCPGSAQCVSGICQEIELLRIFAKIHEDILQNTPFYYLCKPFTTFSDHTSVQSWLIGIHMSMFNILKRSAYTVTETTQLAHYSVLGSLPHLVKNNKETHLRLNNSAYMNDPSEGIVLITSLKHQSPVSGPILNKMYDKMIVNETDIQASEVYLFSLTLRVDELPMWAQYGDKSQGCCLVIRPDFFDHDHNDINQHDMIGNRDGTEESEESRRSYIPYRVIYVNDKTEGSGNPTLLENIELSMSGTTNSDEDIEDLSEIKKELLKMNRYIDLIASYCEKHPDMEEKILEHLTKSIDQIRFLFKSKDYEYEQELRLIRYEPIDSSAIRLNGASAPVPTLYVEREDKRLTYSRVILGSKVETLYRIAPYLKYVDAGIKVERSSVKFR